MLTIETVSLTYEYRTKADHVTPEQTSEHLQNVDTIAENLGYELFKYDPAEGMTAGLNWTLLLLALMTTVIAAHLALKVYRYEPSGQPLLPEERDPATRACAAGWCSSASGSWCAPSCSFPWTYRSSAQRIRPTGTS